MTTDKRPAKDRAREFWLHGGEDMGAVAALTVHINMIDKLKVDLEAALTSCGAWVQLLDHHLPRWRELNANTTVAAICATEALFHRAQPPYVSPKSFKAGSSVRTLIDKRKGVVQSQDDQYVWVLPDGFIDAVAYSPRELRLSSWEAVSATPEPDRWCITIENGECINPVCPLHSL